MARMPTGDVVRPRRRGARGNRRARGFLFSALKIVAPIVLIIAMAGALLAVRLANGPMPVSFLKKPIERSISQQLGTLTASVGGVVVDWTGPVPALNLREVRLKEQSGATVAVIPSAAIDLSFDALFRGQVIPERITLVGPRILAFYTKEGGLALSLEAVAQPSPIAISDGALRGSNAEALIEGRAINAPTKASAAVASSRKSGLQVVSTLASILQSQGEGSRTFREIGVRNATLIVDHDGQQSFWPLSRLNLAVQTAKGGRRSIHGAIAVAARSGGWQSEFTAVNAEDGSGQLVIDGTVDRLNPSKLAASVSNLAAFSRLDAEIGARIRMQLTPNGKIRRAQAQVGLETGRLKLEQVIGETRLGRSRFDLRYRADESRIDLAPSTLRWDGNDLTLVGAANFDSASEQWLLTGNAIGGSVLIGVGQDTDAEQRAPVEEFIARGALSSDLKRLALEQLAVAVGGGRVALAADLDLATGAVRHATAEIGEVPLEAVKAFWPIVLAPEARAWFAANTVTGRVVGGAFRYSPGIQGAQDPDTGRLSASMTARDVVFSPFEGMPFIATPEITVRVEGGALEVSAKRGITRTKGVTAKLRDMRFTSSGILTAERRDEAAFKWSSSLGGAAKVLTLPALGLPDMGKLPKLAGRVDADLALQLPVGATNDWASQVVVQGKATISDGAVQGNRLPFAISGARINVALSDRLIATNGTLLIDGVPAKMRWQYLVSPGARAQPPLRISATLDDEDRRRLGFGSVDMVTGDASVVVKVANPLARPSAAIEADMTASSIKIASLSWQKASGRRAKLLFNLTPINGGGYQLEDLRLVGDRVAIEGTARLNKDGLPVAFDLPTVSLDVVSRLSLKGELKEAEGGPVWSVVARGQTFDGRNFFRSIFNVDPRVTRTAEQQAGVDVEAFIDNVSGFNETRIEALKVLLRKRQGRLVSLAATARFPDQKSLEAGIPETGNRRILTVRTEDAGSLFRLVDFYPSLVGGNLRLSLDLDGKGAATQTGQLSVRQFQVLGDPVVSEVAGGARRGRKRTVTQTVIPFHSMEAPFSLGHGQIVLHDADLRGPLVGVTLAGKADFNERAIDLSGTYSLIQDLNSIPAIVPGLGELLTGPRKEGIFAMTFAVRGPMSKPDVLVDPLSGVAPGIMRDVLRELFQMGPASSQVTPRAGRPDTQAAPQSSSVGAFRRAPDADNQIIGSGGWGTSTSRPLDRSVFERE